MKLLIDIGNTNTALQLLSGDKFVKRFTIHTSRKGVCIKSLSRLLRSCLGDIDEIIIVSVVPRFLLMIAASLRKISVKWRIKVVGKDLFVPIVNKYKYPKQVGQDRLLAAFASILHFPPPAVAIDFGTAVTFDYVNSSREYEGGLIFPGMRLAESYLEEDTALLPSIRIEPAKGFIGKDTKSSMNNGLIYGYTFLCDGMVRKFREKYGSKIKVIATGGDAALIARYSREIDKVVPDLIFEGMREMIAVKKG
ncbi:MAG: type III pantothenate kinase [Candidatus Omnitrophica bacterium]|nr:type III pantothenate kinase [Candidatus Omnitrophota bacterium]